MSTPRTDGESFLAEDSFDYVIVGAGSAGCVLADRLSADGRRVLLLEYGGSDRSIFIQMPSALSIPMNNPRYNWFYHTEPEPHLNGRRMHTPRGKVLGGSSSINGLVYIRGNPLDFDRWQREGAAGWAYRDVLPYFKRSEKRQAGGDAYRGDSDKLASRYGSISNPLHAAWLADRSVASGQFTAVAAVRIAACLAFFRTLEVRQHIAICPTGRAFTLPAIEIQRIAAD